MVDTTVNTDAMKVARVMALKDEKKDLHPVLERLLPKLKGVERTDYTHGSLEHGADFVLEKQDLTTGLRIYVGVVAKCGNINKPESHRIIDQVRECHGDRHFAGGKEKVFLSEIWVVTTGVIIPAARQNIRDNFKASNVAFIDREVLGRVKVK